MSPCPLMLVVTTVLFHKALGPPPPNPNLALGRPTASRTFWDKNSSFAADGNAASGWGQGTCFQSNANDFTPWWQVDLEKVFEITNIVATARSDSCCSDRLHDFSVELFMDNPITTPFQAPKICLYHPGNLAPGVPVNLSCSAVHAGRFVVLRGNATRTGVDDRFTICELEIYGRPGPKPCEPCNRYVRQLDSRMNADEIEKPTVADTVDRCARECTQDNRCKSFNYNKDATPPCELLVHGPLGALPDQNWDHYFHRSC